MTLPPLLISGTRIRRLAAVAAVLVAMSAPALAGGKETDAPNAPAADNPGSALALPPAPEDRAKVLSGLLDRLAKAANESEAAAIRTKIREQWTNSGSPTIDLLLARDAQAGLTHDLALRRRLLGAIIHLAPDNPEGWHRRADLDYAEQHLGDAMADLGHVLVLEPRHFDAPEALATMMREVGRNDLALKAFRRLQAVDPTSANIKPEIDDLARKVEGQRI